MLLQFEVITFRFADGKTLNPLIYMISRFWVLSLSPTTFYFYLWRLQDTSKHQRKSHLNFEITIFMNLKCSEINNAKFGQDGHRKSCRSV